MEIDPDRGLAAAAVLEAVADHVAAHGIRRLDLRTAFHEVAVEAISGARWVHGRVGSELQASLAVAYPWTDAPDPSGRLARAIAPLPAPLRRIVRRVAAVRPAQVPELLRSTGTEALAAVRHRYRPGHHSMPVDGAPPGSHPFAASRYRAIRATFSFVPDALRATTLLDIGCGDGRVLEEGLADGFARVLGRELDPGLAARAQAAIGSAGTVEVGDALADPIPDDVGVVFLNNPFDSTGVAHLATLLGESLGRAPRPLLVLYLNPRPIEPLLDAGLVLVHVDPRFSIFASRAEP
ncbi:MAG: class I SAM-dependent methyltransferase [Aquihabitans sp.]